MIRIVLYEDNPQLREGLSLLLNGSDGLKWSVLSKNCNNVTWRNGGTGPWCGTDGYWHAGTNGIEGLKLIRQQNNTTKVLMLTVLTITKMFLRLSRTAPTDTCLKTPPAKLLEYIQEAHTGGALWSSSICHPGFKNVFAASQPGRFRLSFVRTRKQVLQLLVWL